jgi:hypothetical protein
MPDPAPVPNDPNNNVIIDPNSDKNDAQMEKIDPSVVLANYQKLLSVSFVSALLVIAIFSILFFSTRNYQVTILPVVVLCGSLGAIFSSLIRLYGYSDLPALLSHDGLQGLNARSVLVYATVPIVVGAIASALLYMILASKMISGTLFPEFGCVPEQSCVGIRGLTENFSPMSPIDYAKAIVWGFIAGFAERLVPDAISSFAQAANSAASKQR